MRRSSFLIAAAVILSLAAPAAAHHSSAMFDHTKEIELKGEIKEFQFTTPHAWIQVNVPGARGKVVEWSIEAATPSSLMRAGIKKSSLKPGDKVTVKAHPLRDGRPGASMVTIIKADGTVLDPRGGKSGY
jgi:hypothetical protein